MKQDYRMQAILVHGDQRYGDHVYAFHLSHVEVKLISHGFDSDSWRATAWLHDAIEDTDMTREQVAALYGEDVANIVWACTGIGPNRKARNADIKAKILAHPLAAPTKTSDRLANGEHSKRNKTRQFQMYKDEHPAFLELVGPFIPESMINELQTLFA